MALPLHVLPHQCPDPYRPDVPRLPKNFRIDWVTIERLSPGGYISTGPNTAVPNRFEAHFVLGNPEAVVTIEVFVPADLRPVVLELKIRSKAKAPVTTSVLRQVLVDQLLQRALEEATVSASVREEWLASLPPHVQALAADNMSAAPASADERRRGHADEDARTAAQIYLEAMATGSRAPGVAVANKMNRSRAQVARYIRRARELGLLPPLKQPKGS